MKAHSTTMTKLQVCDRCQFYANDYHLVCALHPQGVEGNSCNDFSPDPNLEGKHFVNFLGLKQLTLENSEAYSNPFDNTLDEDLWLPEGARYVNEELVIERDRSFYCGAEIIQPHHYWTSDKILELLDEHPIFTGRCPMCEMPFPQYEKQPVHWDCSCGWFDDSV